MVAGAIVKSRLDPTEAGIQHTVVVFGSARFVSFEQVQSLSAQAKTSQDANQLAKAKTALKNASYDEAGRAFARLVATDSLQLPPRLAI